MNQVVTDYARRNRYQLNGEKSAVMAFGADAATTRDVKEEYLGVNGVDNVRDWTKYFDRAIAKATRVSEDLEWACRRAGGLRPRAAAALWKAIARPVRGVHG
jgi:hypothetical protein